MPVSTSVRRLIASTVLFILAPGASGQAQDSLPKKSAPTIQSIQSDLALARTAAVEKLNQARQQLLDAIDRARTEAESKPSIAAKELVALRKQLKAERELFATMGQLPGSEIVKAAVDAYVAVARQEKQVILKAYESAEAQARPFEDLLERTVEMRSTIEGQPPEHFAQYLKSVVRVAGAAAASRPAPVGKSAVDAAAPALSPKLRKIRECAERLVEAKPKIAMGRAMTESPQLLAALARDVSEQKVTESEAIERVKAVRDIAAAGTAHKRGGEPAKYQELLVKSLNELLSSLK